ncbi:sigma-70 family RNA polymerase sigma factor [Nannocystis sp. SCPEA4]|uniref:RNA polymerase sigma factor n=1 Tax=Nannocystis sp. SCPEA4 TaxID=2996787 RepID=UPI00226FE6EA|nr:sigma-70 family RNA polymerase sigma factor [Nannocystis sp. SCPEA4]
MSSRPSDEALLAAWRAGDRRAGERLFERYYEPVARFFFNKTDAEAELIQQTFLACVEGAAKFRGEGSFRSYVFAIAYRQLCRHYRDRKGDRLDLTEVSVAAMEPSPSQAMVEGEELRLLLAGLRRIPVDCQVALELLYWEQLTTAEMAAVLEIPEGTVKSRLRRGRALLREAIEALAKSPDLAASTLLGIDTWASALRARAGLSGGQREK